MADDEQVHAMVTDAGSDPTVSVLIVSYRCRDHLRRCLESLQPEVDATGAEVVVVDNGSGDGTVEMVRERFGHIRLEALDRNTGFAFAANLAATRSSGEVIVHLNPDTEVQPGAIRTLVDFVVAHPEAGLVGGRNLRADGSVEPSSCWGAPTLWSTFCFGSGLSAMFAGSRWFDPESLGSWARDSVAEVGVITGCLLAARRSVWRELGGFDERFFLYGEDTDLSLRARARGYRPTITPDAVVVHHIGGSSAASADRRVAVLRGKVTVAHKHWPGRRGVLAAALVRGGVAARAMLVRLSFGHGPIDRSWAEAWRRKAEWQAGYPRPAATSPVGVSVPDVGGAELDPGFRGE